MAFIFLLIFLAFPDRGDAQVPTTLDPTEIQALQIFAGKMEISQFWNFSVDPCSGEHGWNNTKQADNFQPSVGVECECLTNSSFCHVTKLVVFNMDAAGEIAPEIGNLSFLTNLNLGQNIITGRLPEEIGLLTRLQYFNVGINRLRGPFPASIGNLLQIVSMGFGTNYLTGSLPKEIGNLKFMTQIYLDSSGLGGPFPEEFGKLQNLNTIWMSDNNFTGSLNFIGNLTKLTELRIEGNSFQGPIPSTIGDVRNLKTLALGDVTSGGPIPETLSSLSGLTLLSLRNCDLSGLIPDLSNLTMLTTLDLSFNNLSGPLPSSLGSLQALETLILANNKLTGALPSELGSLSNLLRLDVSSNNLTGALPSWLNSSRLQENIIENQINVSNSQGQNAQEMDCLQAGLNCGNVDEGRNFELNINCGGPEVTYSGVTYAGDTSSLTSETYYSNSSQSFAVSSTGYAGLRPDVQFLTTPSTTNRVLGAADSSLYSTARGSPSSLKYFALGLRNGPYTVQFHFAEIVIADNVSGWTSLGRRYFDVYVQGSRVLQDFNIQAQANGSFRAITSSFPTQVSGNVLEIHLLWRGRGTCCSPAPNTFGPLVSAIRVLPGFDTTGLRPALSSESSSDSKALEIGLGVGIPVLIILLAAIIFFFRYTRRRRKQQQFVPDEEATTEELKSLEAGKPNLFSYNDLKQATRDFSAENKLGQGGFGSVFKGVLRDGTPVAIKVLSTKSNQGTREFLNEVTMISAVQHRNLVKLHGCCIEGAHRLLVYEFLENNSLHHALLSSKGTRIPIDWRTRFNICVGIARGIAYLQEESFPRIVHRDIKASNVLLDKTLNPKIADFGLAKLFQDHETHISTRVAGTIGYLAPEYAMRGQLTEKADIYSFGVLALEIVSGRENMNTSLPSNEVYLLEVAWELYENHRALEMVDKELGADFSSEEAMRVIEVALLCSQASAAARPKMSDVVAMLVGNARIDVSALQPGYFSALRKLAPGFYTDRELDDDEAAAMTQKTKASDSSSASWVPSSTSAASSNSNFTLTQPR